MCSSQMSATFLWKIRHKFRINTHAHTHAGRIQKLLRSRKMRNWVSVDSILWHGLRVCVCVCAFVNGYLHCVSQYVHVLCACVHCAKDVCVRVHSCVLAVDTILWPIYLCGSGAAFIDAFITSIPSKRHLQTCSLYLYPIHPLSCLLAYASCLQSSSTWSFAIFKQC